MRYAVMICRPPEGWKPTRWDANPAQARAISMLSPPGDLEGSRACARGFNEAEILAPCGLWALVVRADQVPSPGAPLTIWNAAEVGHGLSD